MKPSKEIQGISYQGRKLYPFQTRNILILLFFLPWNENFKKKFKVYHIKAGNDIVFRQITFFLHHSFYPNMKPEKKLAQSLISGQQTTSFSNNKHLFCNIFSVLKWHLCTFGSPLVSRDKIHFLNFLQKEPNFVNNPL